MERNQESEWNKINMHNLRYTQMVLFDLFWVDLVDTDFVISAFTLLTNLVAPFSGWWKWTCPLRMTTLYISHLPWWLWSAPPWRSNWHQVSYWVYICLNYLHSCPYLSRFALSLFQIYSDAFISWYLIKRRAHSLSPLQWVRLVLLVPFPLIREVCVGWCV